MRLGHAIFVATTAALLAAAVPGLAKNAVRALDEAAQIEADRDVHVNRLPDLKVVLAVVATENPLKVLKGRFGHTRKMRRNRAGWSRHEF